MHLGLWDRSLVDRVVRSHARSEGTGLADMRPAGGIDFEEQRRGMSGCTGLGSGTGRRAPATGRAGNHLAQGVHRTDPGAVAGMLGFDTVVARRIAGHSFAAAVAGTQAVGIPCRNPGFAGNLGEARRNSAGRTVGRTGFHTGYCKDQTYWECCMKL